MHDFIARMSLIGQKWVGFFGCVPWCMWSTFKGPVVTTDLQWSQLTRWPVGLPVCVWSLIGPTLSERPTKNATRVWCCAEVPVDTHPRLSAWNHWSGQIIISSSSVFGTRTQLMTETSLYACCTGIPISNWFAITHCQNLTFYVYCVKSLLCLRCIWQRQNKRKYY